MNSKISLPGSYFGMLSIYKQNDSINIIMQEDTYLDRSSAASNLSANTIVNKIPDIRAYDLIRSFNFIINTKTIPNEARAYVHLKLVDFEDKRNFPLVFFSIWTLGIPSLIGIPFNSSVTKLSIEVSVLNKDFRLLKKYKASGKGQAFMALYWGYGKDLNRKSNLNAFTEAFTSIENQIACDIEFLNNQLSNQP